MKNIFTGISFHLTIFTLFICLLWIAAQSKPAPAQPIKPLKTVQMEITGYCQCSKCCGDWADGFFADGSPVGGKAIAADTRYYAMGTAFDVPGYGVATVKDRGGAIKGDNRLDLYFGDKDGISGHQRALNWGRKKNVTVTIIERDLK